MRDAVRQHANAIIAQLDIFLMKKMRSAFRDRVDVNHSGEIAGTGVLLVPGVASVDEWQAIASEQQRALMQRHLEQAYD